MSDVETQADADAVQENPFEAPLSPEPPPPETPLAAYDGKLLEWQDAGRRIELFEERLKSWTTLPSGAVYGFEFPLSAFRRDPDSVWRRSWSFLPYVAVLGSAAPVAYVLTVEGGPCSGLGGKLACLAALLGLWTLLDLFGSLTQPKLAGASFPHREGGELLTFVESTPDDPQFISFVQTMMQRIERAPPPASPFGIDRPGEAVPAAPAAPAPGPPKVVYVETRAPWNGDRTWRLFTDRVEVEAERGWWSGGRSRIDLAHVVPRPERTFERDPDRFGWARGAAIVAAAAWFALLCGATWSDMGLPWYERPWFFLSAGIPMLLLSVFLRICGRLVPRRAAVRFNYENGQPALILFRSPSRAALVDAFAEAVSRQAEAFRGAAGR